MKADPGEKGSLPDAATDARAKTSAGENDSLTDPFAVDLFAAHRAPAETSAQDPQDAHTGGLAARADMTDAVRWHARLPRISKAQARLSSSLAAVSTSIPALVMKACAQVLSRYGNVRDDEVSITVLDWREAELSSLLRDAETAPRLWASLAVEPDGSHLLIEMDASFGAALIDRVLGGDGSAPDSLRPLSRAEQPIMEFLWLSLLHRLKAELREPLFHLESLTNKPPAWLDQQSSVRTLAAAAMHAKHVAESRGLILAVRIAVASTVGLARCGITTGALASLNATQNPLLARERERVWSARLLQLKRLAPEVSLRVLIGETEVEVKELAQLEEGDVMIIERATLRWDDGRMVGTVRLRASDGPGPLITGRIEPAPASDPGVRGQAEGTSEETTKDVQEVVQDAAREALREAARVNLIIETVQGVETGTVAEQLKMEEDATGEATTAEGAAALEGLMLTVHVELAARRIGLEELSRLRAGQIIELDCRATDPVELIAEGRRIARGELVEIEGRLGVRIIQLAR